MMNKLLSSLVVLSLAAGVPATFLIAYREGVASAQPATPDAGSIATTPTATSAGSGSAVDKVHDPIAQPAQAFDDLKAAKKTSWGIFVLTAMIIVCRVLGRFGGYFSKLREGKVALAVAAFTALSMTMFNAIALGGSWVAAMAAGVTAMFAAWDSKAPPKTAEPSVS